LHLLSIYPLSDAIWLEASPYIDPALEESYQKRYETYLAEVSERLSAKGVAVKTTVLGQSGSISEVIAEQAEELKPDLVVMTTHGWGGLTRMFLGSIADELIRQLPMPLIIIRPEDGKVDLDNLPSLKKVLIPLDGAPEAEKMLPSAGKLARVMDAELTLFRSLSPVPSSHYEPQGFKDFDEEAEHLVEKTEEAQAHLLEKAEEYLKAMADHLRAEGLKVETKLATRPHPASVILKLVEQEGFDLIALETHGRKGLSRLFLGSVADKLIRSATVPVMVHRPHHE
jgi:nucleotide-binding universal stress UspA family protein